MTSITEYMYICMYVFMYVLCMYACVVTVVCICITTCLNACLHLSMYRSCVYSCVCIMFEDTIECHLRTSVSTPTRPFRMYPYATALTLPYNYYSFQLFCSASFFD